MSGFISKFLRPHEAEGLKHVRSYLWFFGFLVVILFLISITDSGTRIDASEKTRKSSSKTMASKSDLERGLEAQLKKDYVEAEKWYLIAAEKNDLNAQLKLGYLYANEKSLQDYNAAVKWYVMAANQGHPSAQNNLGVMYAHGRGVPRNDTEAVKWFRMAAELGSPTAQLNLGRKYTTGSGVKKDLTKAEKWLREAALQGEKDAKTYLKENFVYINIDDSLKNDDFVTTHYAQKKLSVKNRGSDGR